MSWSEVYHIDFPTTPYEFHLHGLCDLQLGSDSTSLSMIRTRIHEIINDPCDSGVIIPGDIEDEDRPSTRAIRRSAFAEREEVIFRDAEKHMAWLDKAVIPMLLPLQNTKYGIMGILAGHHWTQLSPVLNSAQYICQELSRLSKKRVPYMGEMSCFMDLRFRSSRNKHVRRVGHIQHGEGGGQTKSAAINKLDRASQGFIADFYVRGHDCQIAASKSQQLYPKELKDKNNAPEMMAKEVVLLNLGAATKGYDMDVNKTSYVERKMMRPSALGWGTIKFKVRRALAWEDRNHSMKVEMKIEI